MDLSPITAQARSSPANAHLLFSADIVSNATDLMLNVIHDD